MKRLLEVTSALEIKPQQKLKIWKIYIPTQFKFELWIYDISSMWIDLNLNSQVSNCVKDWIELPISSCVSEILSLPSNRCGLGNRHTLTQRGCWNTSTEPEVQTDLARICKIRDNLEADNREEHDHRSNHSGGRRSKISFEGLEGNSHRNNSNHIHILTIQGQIINAINEAFAKSTVTKWMKEVEKLAPPLYKFVRKALQQQFPTASNLVRWGKSKDTLCPLCQQIQSSKHVMSHCNSTIFLKRYKEILIILADWILQQCKAERKIFVDLDGGNFNPLSELFQSLRPDIAGLGPNNDIEVLSNQRSVTRQTATNQDSTNNPDTWI